MSEIESNPEIQAESSPVEANISPEIIEAKVAPQSPKNDDVITISRTTLNYFVIAGVFFTVGILVGLLAFGVKVDKATIETAVRDVLVDAGIMMPFADMEVLSRGEPFLGTEDAPIVIVEFSAYACPYCGRHFQETFAPLLENYGQYIRYVYRDFPTINPTISVPASLAANCALEQGKFWEYHDLLFTNQELLSPDYFNQAAEELSLDMGEFTACVDEQRYVDEVNSDYNTGIAYGVSGTPGFYINGNYYSGARPYEYFERVILRELEDLGIEPS